MSDSKCITADKLSSMLNINKFNKMMDNTSSKVNSFIDSYIKEQQDIKDKVADRQSSLEAERYKQTAMNAKRKLAEKHKQMMTLLRREFNLLENQIQNLENTKDLFKMLKKQNTVLQKTVEKQIHTIEISDRKTYYENTQNSTAGWWSHHFQNKYKYLIILIIIAIILSKRYKELKLWGIVVALALYPVIAFKIVKFLENIWNWIKSNSRLVYLNL